MSTLSIRIEEKTKREANKTLKALGLDMSTAVKMFLSQVVIEQGMPFRSSRNPQQIKAEWDMEVTEALKGGKRYGNATEMFKDVLGDTK